MQKKLLGLCLAVAVAACASIGYAAESKVISVKAPVVETVMACEAPQVAQANVAAPAQTGEAFRAKLAAGDYFGAVMAFLFGGGGLGMAMTTLAANKPRAYETGDYTELPVVATDIIFEGAAVGWDGTSIARPLVAGDRFAGFAARKADNQTVAGAAGAINVLVLRRGLIRLPITSTVVGDVGKAVYASDDDTFTLTETNNAYVGKIQRNDGTGFAIVEFDAGLGANIAELVDSSGGTADGTLVAIGTAYSQTEVRNNFADLSAKVNSLLRMAKSGG